MKSSNSLYDVLQRAALWMRNRKSLLVCEDLRRKKENKYGYINAITSLLRYAPRIILVISNRDRNIAQRADEIVEFSFLDVECDRSNCQNAEFGCMILI